MKEYRVEVMEITNEKVKSHKGYILYEKDKQISGTADLARRIVGVSRGEPIKIISDKTLEANIWRAGDWSLTRALTPREMSDLLIKIEKYRNNPRKMEEIMAEEKKLERYR